MAQLPTLVRPANVGPYYIHKITRKSHWNNGEGPEREIHAAQSIFGNENPEYSFWRVDDNRDFYAVLGFIASTRLRGHDEVSYIGATSQELFDVGLTPSRSPEGDCKWAAPLHHAVFIHADTALTLCQRLMKEGRESARVSESQMKVVLASQLALGCLAFSKAERGCACEAWARPA